MKININGVTRDMTAVEEAEILANVPEQIDETASQSSRLDDIEAALMELAELLGGTE